MTEYGGDGVQKPVCQIIIFVLACAVLATVHFAEPQEPGKVYRIGFLGNSTPSADAIRIEAFRQGLHELRYVEGKNVVIEFRYAEGKLERLPDLAAELVHLKVDVIVARGTRAAKAAKQATRTIPIVMAMVADPVRSGVIASLARPGGNITGLTTIMPELTGKQLELLREIVPAFSRVAFLARSGVSSSLFEQEAQDAAQRLGVSMQLLRIKGPGAFEDAFSAMTREQADALIVQPFFVGGLGLGRRLAALALRNRLPTISSQMRFADEGGLISYGPDVLDMTRRAAYFVDKVLQGVQPAELPVEQPTKFNLVINLKTADALGLKIPPIVLYQATRVIR